MAKSGKVLPGTLLDEIQVLIFEEPLLETKCNPLLRLVLPRRYAKCIFFKDRDQIVSYSVSKVLFRFKERLHLIIKIRKSSMSKVVFKVSNPG